MRHPSDSLLAGFPSDSLYSHIYIHATCSVPPVLLYIVHADNVWRRVHVVELLFAEFLSRPTTSPALRKETPTVQTARLWNIIICIFREKSGKDVHYNTKNDFKISKCCNFGAFYFENFKICLSATCWMRSSGSWPFSPAKQVDVLLYCNWLWGFQLWENKIVEKYRAEGDRCESHVTPADFHTICQH